jgi:hypoxanthine-DNA glycosylase
MSRFAHVHGFPPIASATSRVLILGSMPGQASLRANEYYAHPRNAFWRIIDALYQIDAAAPYPQRVTALRARGVALWDVLASCSRASSLDSDIDEASIVVNAFGAFLAKHPRVRTICFNGAKAESCDRKYVVPSLGDSGELRSHRLPSTSPAHAAMSLPQKVAAWRAALDPPRG